MIKRDRLLAQIRGAVKRSRVVCLLGPRQCGKTTLARLLVKPGSLNYFDLEDPRHLARLENPMEALGSLEGLTVIDEVQRRPEIFPVLRVLADRTPLPSKFLVLGSSSPALQRQTSESLAGRISSVMMEGFTLEEVGWENREKHWLRGGYPRSFLATTDKDSSDWRRSFIQTFLERDIPQFGFSIPATTMGRFWAMTAHYHGQTWNGSELARSLGMSLPTIHRYLDLLSDLFMIRQLQPWHANLKKRQVKAPKIYFRDTGLLHQLLGIHTKTDLLNHPKNGASWEGYVIEEIFKIIQPEEAYFWSTHQGAEMDLLLRFNGRMYGVECKMMDAPRLTPSMKIAQSDLKLEKIAVIYPGTVKYSLADGIQAVPFKAILGGIQNLFN